MKNFMHSNINKFPDEIALLSNSYKYKIDIYTCNSSKVKYIFRRRSNQALICKIDKDCNLIGLIQSPILVSDLDKAFYRLKEYIELTSWVDDYFSF